MAFFKKMKCPKCGWTTEVPSQGRACPNCKAFIAPAPEGRPNLGPMALSKSIIPTGKNSPENQKKNKTLFSR